MERYEHEEELINEGNFGYIINENSIDFKVWAPDCDEINLLVYDDGDSFQRVEYPMKRENNGIWEGSFSIKLKNKYYTYQVCYTESKHEVVDPYAVAVGTNSKRAMIVDLAELYIEGWKNHQMPAPLKESEAVIYETHIRDFTAHESSNVINKGKYLGVTETHEYNNIITGLGHLEELGITHLHLLPVYDFATVDDNNDQEYNWGYDPYLYNALEGSYSTDSSDGRVRIKEFQELIMKCHEKGIRVVLDVVYNHTYFSKCSNFNRLVPNYYYRLDENKNFSDGSGVGNEIATEKPMVRKFIIESLLYWLKTYKVDGFRFDLLSLMDTVTMAKISKALRAENPNVLLYGEPWTGGKSELPEERRMTKGKQKNIRLSLFNDDFRNAIRGDNHGENDGFVCGNAYFTKEIKKGIVGSIHYSDILNGFTKDATESINYVSCHDDLILVDRLKMKKKCLNYGDIVKLNKLSLSIILTSYGIPFIQAGTEFMRTKQMVNNSYNVSGEINQIDWALKAENIELYTYIKNLIAFRKESGIFIETDEKSIIANLSFLDTPELVIGYKINSENKKYYIFHNALNSEQEVEIPPNNYKIVADAENVYISDRKVEKLSKLTLSAVSTTIICEE